MEAQLDTFGGAMLKTAMEAMGVEVHLNMATTEIIGDAHVEGLRFKDGSSLACDMIVVSAGIRPNAEIGTLAGLTVERAIVVDDHMRCLDETNIYAVGECAQHRGRVYGLVAPLWEGRRRFLPTTSRRSTSRPPTTARNWRPSSRSWGSRSRPWA